MRISVRNSGAGLALAGVVLLLSGCGSKQEPAKAPGGPKSMGDVRSEAAQLDRPEPGQYRQSIEVTRFEVPGMPKDAAEQMKRMMTASQQTTICLTKADTERGYRDMFKDVGKGDDCRYSKFDVDDGRIDARMDCKSAQEGTATMLLDGTVKPDGSDVTVAMEMQGGQQPMGNVRMTLHLKTERVGDCPQ